MGAPGHLHGYSYASTAAYDLGEKFRHYARIGSLREVVYVSQGELRIEGRRRGDDGAWSANVYGAGEIAVVESIGCHLAVDEIYRDVPAR